MKKLSDDRILGLFNVIDEKLTNQVSKLEEIHVQTKLTNGRVTTLEGWRKENEGKSGYQNLLWLLLTTLVGLVVYLIK